MTPEQEQPQPDDTPEQQIRQRITALVERASRDADMSRGIPIADFTPYLLIKVLERLESIESHLSGIDSSITDFWNTRYNS